MAFIHGSGHDIPNFDETIKKIKTILLNEKSISLQTCEAKNSFELLSFFAKHNQKPFSLIIYYGHAQFGNCNENIGLVCHDGSIFSNNDCEVLYNNPPQCMLVNACQSARGKVFNKNSFAYTILKTGVETFIGTHFLLEAERSFKFLKTFLNNFVKTNSPFTAFQKSISALSSSYGPHDISIYNYVYYEN